MKFDFICYLTRFYLADENENAFAKLAKVFFFPNVTPWRRLFPIWRSKFKVKFFLSYTLVLYLYMAICYFPLLYECSLDNKT